MKSEWSDSEYASIVADYAQQEIPEDLAARVYTSRLLGRNPRLVIHGGGNTSAKSTAKDFLGERCDVLYIKGSGWDLGTIEPEGLPAVRLTPMHLVRQWDEMSDEDMVRFLRSNLLDTQAPTPSVETLLHAYLPQKFVDHAHASAILSLSDQPDGEAICREVYGDRIAIVPYVMPGFALSKVTADVFDANPDVEGLILHKHGIFTFGASARESYERMISLVSTAEDRIQAAAGASSDTLFTPIELPVNIADVADVAPIIRGACAERTGKNTDRHYVLDFRSSERIRAYVDGAQLADYATRGVVTPDHIIRTKNKPLILPIPVRSDPDGFEASVRKAVGTYRSDYRRYFEQYNETQQDPKTMLETSPRVALVPGLGLFGLGKNKAAAGIAADLAELSIDTISDAEVVGRYEALDESDLFEMEYWSLEQAKLARSSDKALAGQVALVTGGGGTIGSAVARLFAEHGAEVAVLDIDQNAADEVCGQIGPHALALQCDVTNSAEVRQGFDRICSHFGGIDILVSNAGAAWESSIGDIDDELLRRSFELNFFSHQAMAQNAVRVMRSQGTGGVLLFNASKQAVNPGANFGAYGLPKAATLFLSRQYALEYGEFGIRSNAVNADRIRSGLLTDEMIESRSRSRGQTTESYLAGNLLGQEVTAEDVALAFLYQALSPRTTADVTTVDGGNIAAALR